MCLYLTAGLKQVHVINVLKMAESVPMILQHINCMIITITLIYVNHNVHKYLNPENTSLTMTNASKRF